MVCTKTFGEKVFDVLNHIILALLVVLTLYPCWYVLVASVSDPVLVSREGSGLLMWPKGFDLFNYARVFDNIMIWSGYRNTLFYVLFGGALSLFLTITSAFALTRKGLPGRNTIMLLIIFTMYFSGGLIPTYLVVKHLHITDTIFAVFLPMAVSTYNLIITISYFKSIPPSLEEAAKIDGASDFKVLFAIMIPLAMPIIAVIALYYMVGIWNNYFQGLIYLNDRKLFPLQLILREILIQEDASMLAGSGATDTQAYAENIKYATIVVSTVPILLVYPFLQKYFVKGVMIGAVKE